MKNRKLAILLSLVFFTQHPSMSYAMEDEENHHFLSPRLNPLREFSKGKTITGKKVTFTQYMKYDQNGDLVERNDRLTIYPVKSTCSQSLLLPAAIGLGLVIWYYITYTNNTCYYYR